MIISFHQKWVMQNQSAWYLALGLCFLFYLYEWFSLRKTVDKKLHWDLLGNQIVTLGTFVLITQVLRLNDMISNVLLVFLHGIVWIFYPWMRDQFKMSKTIRNQMAFNIGVSAAMAALFFPLFRLGPDVISAIRYVWTSSFYFHVFIGFVASYAAPVLLRNYFQPSIDKMRTH